MDVSKELMTAVVNAIGLLVSSMARSPDLKDQRFGRLIVQEKSTNRNKNGEVLWVCQCDCGNTTTATTGSLRKGSKGKRSCGCLVKECNNSRPKGPNSYNWKGGRYTDKYGYIQIRLSNHPRANMGYIREHILVVEKFIGRFLLKGETVHHINGVKDDNRIENLELWDKGHPAGQRVEDKIKWAVDILSVYAPYFLKKSETACDKPSLELEGLLSGWHTTDDAIEKQVFTKDRDFGDEDDSGSR